MSVKNGKKTNKTITPTTSYRVRNILETIAFFGVLVAGIGALVWFAHVTDGVADKIANYIVGRGII